MARMGGIAGADLRIQRIDAARLDPDEHFTLTRHRPGDLC